MTIDEAIKERQKVIEVQEKLYEEASSDESKEIIKSAIDNDRQLAEWLTELKQWRRVYGVCPSYEMCIPECKEGYNAQIAEYKRLLKMAVEDINFYVDCYEAHCDECCCTQDNHCHWKHEAEALKLLKKG
jgi:hypothetical protein